MTLHQKKAGQASFGLALFINAVWLGVGGIMTFWIGAAQLPWMIVGILVTVIGVTGINLAFSERTTE